jgi:sugar/nucleoside kinase (ribokinase family)
VRGAGINALVPQINLTAAKGNRHAADLSCAGRDGCRRRRSSVIGSITAHETLAAMTNPQPPRIQDTDAAFDVMTIGNAIVDMLAHTDDNFLVDEGLIKGSMRLIEEEEADRLYNRMGPAVEISGGSAANTAAGVASLGGKVTFVGKVANDPLGRIFRHDIRAQGVAFDSADLIGGPATARSMILVSPDGERTMNTYLGACQHLTVDDIDADRVRASRIVYMEGYLWDREPAKEAFRKAAQIAHAHGRRVSITLSDSFCVDRWREEFLVLARSGLVDLVFANTSEVKALYQTADFDSAIAQLRQDVAMAVVTQSEHGCMVLEGAQTWQVAAHPVETLVDTTGAGDLFAAGFLHGLCRGRSHQVSARIGAVAAAEIITHIGARPQADLADLVRQAGVQPI